MPSASTASSRSVRSSAPHTPHELLPPSPPTLPASAAAAVVEKSAVPAVVVVVDGAANSPDATTFVPSAEPLVGSSVQAGHAGPSARSTPTRSTRSAKRQSSTIGAGGDAEVASTNPSSSASSEVAAAETAGSSPVPMDVDHHHVPVVSAAGPPQEPHAAPQSVLVADQPLESSKEDIHQAVVDEQKKQRDSQELRVQQTFITGEMELLSRQFDLVKERYYEQKFEALNEEKCLVLTGEHPHCKELMDQIRAQHAHNLEVAKTRLELTKEKLRHELDSETRRIAFQHVDARARLRRMLIEETEGKRIRLEVEADESYLDELDDESSSSASLHRYEEAGALPNRTSPLTLDQQDRDVAAMHQLLYAIAQPSELELFPTASATDNFQSAVPGYATPDVTSAMTRDVQECFPTPKSVVGGQHAPEDRPPTFYETHPFFAGDAAAHSSKSEGMKPSSGKEEANPVQGDVEPQQPSAVAPTPG